MHLQHDNNQHEMQPNKSFQQHINHSNLHKVRASKNTYIYTTTRQNTYLIRMFVQPYSWDERSTQK